MKMKTSVFCHIVKLSLLWTWASKFALHVQKQPYNHLKDKKQNMTPLNSFIFLTTITSPWQISHSWRRDVWEEFDIILRECFMTRSVGLYNWHHVNIDIFYRGRYFTVDHGCWRVAYPSIPPWKGLIWAYQYKLFKSASQKNVEYEGSNLYLVILKTSCICFFSSQIDLKTNYNKKQTFTGDSLEILPQNLKRSAIAVKRKKTEPVST